MRSYSIKHVTLAKLKGEGLSFSTLQSLAAPCLNWCHQFLSHPPRTCDISGTFRSQELRDATHKVFPFSCHTRISESFVIDFDRFLQQRSKLTSRAEMTNEDVQRELRRPQSLLVTDWSGSLFDGALVPETDGFIDADGMPPWDTWICLVQASGSQGLACLLSWVPSWLTEKVDSAIRVDAAECLSWLVVQGSEKLRLHGWGKSWQELTAKEVRCSSSFHTGVRQPRTLPVNQNPDFRALEAHADSVLGSKGYKLLRRMGSSSWIDPRLTPIDASVRFKLCNYEAGLFFGSRAQWANELGISLHQIGSQSLALGSSGALFRGDYVINTSEGHRRIGEIAALFPSAGDTQRGN